MNETERDHFLAQLEDQIAAAEKSYMAQAGGEAVCQLHKDGQVTGGLKYDEGQVVALRALRRAMKTAHTFDALVAEVASMQVRWQDELENHRRRNRPVSWIAYSQGGLDAVTITLERVSNAESC